MLCKNYLPPNFKQLIYMNHICVLYLNHGNKMCITWLNAIKSISNRVLRYDNVLSYHVSGTHIYYINSNNFFYCNNQCITAMDSCFHQIGEHLGIIYVLFPFHAIRVDADMKYHSTKKAFDTIFTNTPRMTVAPYIHRLKYMYTYEPLRIIWLLRQFHVPRVVIRYCIMPLLCI